MKLRKLKKKDARLMLEWMHDESIVKDLSTNFVSKTIDDCYRFIESSLSDSDNIHLAVVSDSDEYMGTVSLKRVDRIRKRAEFAITVRKKAMGHGYSWFGMNEIIKLGFNQENLDSIYWCVSKNNARACKFYDKHGFNTMLDIDEEILSHYQNLDNLKWYIIKKEDNLLDIVFREDNLAKIIKIKTIGTENAGQLSFVESTSDIPFEIKRIYYITKVDEGVRRGFHAHKELKQLLFCPFGKINLLLDDGRKKEEILLDNPSIGILIEKPIWREMLWIEKNSVLCVLASDFFTESDYIRNYLDFLNYIGNN